MKIGLTYDLRSEYLASGYSEYQTAEFDRDDTIDTIERTLQQLGYRTDRIGNAKQLIERLVTGDQWDLVFNIAEGLNGIAREAQVPAILDLYEIPYTFSDPLVMSLTLHKAMAKRVIRDAGIPTTDFITVECWQDAKGALFDPPYFIKPVAEGTGKGVSPASIVQARDELADACESLLLKHKQPVLVESYLPGRELTVGILGTGQRAKALGTVEVHLLDQAEQGVYSYNNKEHCETLVHYHLVRADEDSVVEKAEMIALDVWKVLDCRDAGRVDLRCDRHGNPLFLEVNPLAGLHPEHSDLPILCNMLGIPYQKLIQGIVDSAVNRIKHHISNSS